MITSNPYFRAFIVGAVWFGAVAIKMVSQHSRPWQTYPFRNLVVLVVAWAVTALLIGVAATHFQKLRSWGSTALATMAGSFLVMGLMMLTTEWAVRSPPAPKFKSTAEMMTYFAAETTKWVKRDRGIDLDYSLESVRIVEEELDRISKDVDKTNPKRGTFGIALGYGAYIGEVFRRRNGGAWNVDDPTGGAGSYPLTTTTNGIIFPVGWCWKRLINGEEDNVFHKATAFADYQTFKANPSKPKDPAVDH